MNEAAEAIALHVLVFTFLALCALRYFDVIGDIGWLPIV